MKFRQPNVHHSLASLATITISLLPSPTQSMPVQYHLTASQMECHYAPIHQFETVTTSVFITSGDNLKVRTKLQGPIAPVAIASSAEVLAAAMRVDKISSSDRNNFMNHVDDLDFENLYNDDANTGDDDWDDDDDAHDAHDAHAKESKAATGTHDGNDDMAMDDVMFQDYYYMDDDDEYQFMEDDAMDDVEISEVRKARAERDALTPEDKQKKVDEKRVEKKKKMEEFKLEREKQKKRKDEDARKMRQDKLDSKKRKMMKNAEGLPVENTYEITDEGWYRFCVEATHGAVSLEFEMRRSSQLGKPNSKTGHIQTFERHDMLVNEKKLMAKLSAASKAEGGGVSEQDLKTTKEQVTRMNRLLNEIREKQVNERHRLGIHKAVNEHSHSRMVVGSLFETVLYIAVSGFQVYTIRKWFSGNPILAY